MLGSASLTSADDYNPSGMAEAFPALASSSGTVTKLTVFVDTGTTAAQLAAGLYEDAGGHPGHLIAAGSTMPAEGAWNSVDVSARLEKGATYWIALLGSGGRLRYHASQGGATAFASEQGNLTALPELWTNGQAYREGPVSAFGVGTASPAGPSAPADKEPPSVPGDFAASDVGETALGLSWAPSSDNVGVVAYELSLNGQPLRSVRSPSARFSGLTCGTAYAIGVVAVDAAGNRSAEGKITVSTAGCPEPSTLLGTSSLGSNGDWNPAGVAEAFRATAAASGRLASLLVYIDAGTTAKTVVGGIYADDGGQPGALLGQGSAPATAGEWSSIPVSGEVSAGRDYWIAVLAPEGKLAYRDSASGSPAYASRARDLHSLPDDWTSADSYAASPLSAYAVGAGS